MFDANMRCLPKGTQFFCSVCFCKEHSSIHRLGARSGDIFRCKMLDDSEERPRVSIKINGKVYILKYGDEFWDMLLIYEGMVNGLGFINDDSEARSLEILGGKWL